MLKWLRKYSRSWFIALVIGGIVVVFIFWGVGSLSSPSTHKVAEVNGTPILTTTFYRTFNEMVKQYQEKIQGELTEETIKLLRLREQALNRLIEEVLLLQAAERLGIQVKTGELQEQIRNNPIFQEDGHFSERRYFLLLKRARLSPGDFEAQERRRLLLQKLYHEVTAFAKVSDGELMELFRMGKETVSVKYLMISPERHLAQQNPPDGEVARYYEENQATFRLPTRVKVSYLLFRSKDFMDRVQLTPAEVEDYLKQKEAEFQRPKVIQARHLLLKATPAQRPQVEKQAQELLAKARGGEDFAQLARLYSQDPGTKEKGGELGTLKRGQMQPELEKVAFSLKAGEVGMASTPQGIYLIKVEEIKETERDPEAQARATQRLKEEKARRLAEEAARQAREELGGASMAEVAKKLGMTAKETPLLALRDPVPELGALPTFNQAALRLKPREFSRVVDLPLGFAVLQGLEHQPEHVPPLEQIKDRVRDTLKKQLALKMAEQEAGKLLANLKKGDPLPQVAAQAGFPVQESGAFTRFQGFMRQIQAEPLTSAAFQLSPKNPYPPQPLLWQDKYYLMAFKERGSPDPAEFQKERDKLQKDILENKQRLLFESWLAQERRRAKIKVFELP
jgi:peptidyl-prolyl cis-trans isomerase D